MRSSTETLIVAMRVLAKDIHSEDGVANAAIAEAAERLDELEQKNLALRNEIARLNGQTMWICTCGGTDCEGQKENAALRADKERLDWLLTGDGGFWVNWMYEKDEWTPELKASRDAIDACRNWRIGNGRQP